MLAGLRRSVVQLSQWKPWKLDDGPVGVYVCRLDPNVIRGVVMRRFLAALLIGFVMLQWLPSAAVAAPGGHGVLPTAEDDLAWSDTPTLSRVVPLAGTPIYWASCGMFDDDNKVVKLFPINRSRDAIFRCGHHGSGNNYGYRHMLANKDRWEGLTAGTYQSWRDIADLAMVKTAGDPAERVSASGGQQCRAAIIYLVNLRTGATVRSVVVRMYVRASDWRINTVIPGGWCK